MSGTMTPTEIFISCFAIAAFGGLAALLKSDRALTFRNVAGQVLYCGMTGLVIGLGWYHYIGPDNQVFFIIAAAGLAGLGNAALTDHLIKTITDRFTGGPPNKPNGG